MQSASERLQAFENTIFLDSEFAKTRRRYGRVISNYHRNPYKSSQHGYTQEVVQHIEDRLADIGFLSAEELHALQAGERIKNGHLGKKLVEWEQAVNQVQAWKDNGKIIGFIHGTFDPPHLIHARIFRKVKELGKCDYVVVALNNDAYNQKMKSKPDDPRPRFSQFNWKREQVASLPTVDLVTRFPIADATSANYVRLYKEIGAQIVGFGIGADKPEERIQSAQEAGATGLRTPKNGITFSSTELMRRLQDPTTQENTGYSLKKTRRKARIGEVRANIRRVLRI